MTTEAINNEGAEIRIVEIPRYGFLRLKQVLF